MDRIIRKSFFARHRRLFVISGGTFFAATLAVWLHAAMSINSHRMDKRYIASGVVARGTLLDYMPLRLTIVPRDIVFVDATEGGRVESLFVNPGDFVEAGRPLLALSNTQLEMQVLEQEARQIESITQLQNYQTMLEQSRLQNELAMRDLEFNLTRLKRSLERREGLAAEGIVSRESVDELRDQIESFEQKRTLQAASNGEQASLRDKQIPKIRTQIESLQRDLEFTRSKLDGLTVRAPVDGRVTSLDLKIGQTLRQGERLAQVTRDTGFKLSQRVDEYYLASLREGQQGTIDLSGTSYPLRVSRLYPEVKDGTFAVDFEFVSDAPDNLLPGQTVQGKLSFGQGATAVYMPSGAYLESSGGNWVFVLAADGSSANRRVVHTGRRNPEQVEVLGGLQPGERILTSAYTGLDDVDRIVFE